MVKRLSDGELDELKKLIFGIIAEENDNGDLVIPRQALSDKERKRKEVVDSLLELSTVLDKDEVRSMAERMKRYREEDWA